MPCFYDLEKNEVIDYIGGVADLNRKILQTVGSAQQRFSEDHLRILRGIRFVRATGFLHCQRKLPWRLSTRLIW